MTVRAYPFDTTAPAGSVTEVEWRRLMRWIMPSGVLRGEDDGLAVTQRAAGANMSVDVATGQAFIVGNYLRSDAVESVAIPNNATGNPRIDTIVAGVDFVANTANIYRVAGVAAAAPAPTALTQDLDTLWEIPLAYIYVAAGESTSIDNSEIADAREYAAPQNQQQERLARLATTAALAASTVTGLNRVANANGALGNIDGTAPAVGDDILDKDHATTSARGLWRIVDLGSATKPWRMVRSPLADTSAKVRAGLWIRVTEGTANHDAAWLLTTDNPIVLGTTGLTFTQFPPASVTVPTTVKVVIPQTWVWPAAVAIPSGTTDAQAYTMPWSSGGVSAPTGVRIIGYSGRIESGTSFTFKMQVMSAGGVVTDITGYTGLGIAPTGGANPTPQAIGSQERIRPVVTAVSGSPTLAHVTVWLEYTFTLA